MLETATSYNGLPVCPKCGWAETQIAFETHVRTCSNGAAGAAAGELAARVPALKATKFGYGDGFLTFEPDEAMHIRLACMRNGAFKLEDVWLLDSLSIEEATSLVRAIAAWRRDYMARQRQVAQTAGTEP